MTKADLTRSNILSHSGAIITDSANNGAFGIFPQFKGGISNSVVRSGSGDYDGGDRVIGFPNGYEVDGDLLFTVGWGDGFAVRRLNNDGTLSRIYYENQFLYRDTGSTYNHMHNIAIDTTNKLGVVMTHNVDGYTTFDYSGCVDGGTTFVKDARPSHSNPQRFIGGAGSSGLNISSVGLYYSSGLVAAGEWIYAGEYDGRHYRRAVRRNLNTGVEEVIGNSSGTGDLYSGSATIDRNGYRYTLSYDEVNDRVFYQAYYGGSMIVVLDASTSTPELLWVDLGDAGQGTNSYDMGIFIPDPVNAPNRMWIGHYNRFNDIDITPCLSGSAPTIHANIPSITYFVTNPLNRLGTKYQKTSGTPMDKIPSYPNFVPLNADRGRCDVGGWIDTSNNVPVAIDDYSSVTEDTSNGRGISPYFDYSAPAVLMSSSNGTKYWVKMGYGGYGHQFHVWAENTKPYELKGNWEIIFGTFTLDNNANIDHVSLPQVSDFGIPSSTTLTIYVSNNNGSSWETYDKNSNNTHVFSTSGTQLRIKFSANGQPDKAPYYSGSGGDGPMNVFYGSLHEASKDSSIKFKVNRKRLGRQ
jgi:hypothetical protein